MIGSSNHEVERKVISILKILSESSHPLGARLIARQLKEQGVELGERAVRYHLKLTDERGLTQPAKRWDGREITPLGIEELNNALVTDKIGFVLEKIELLAFRTSFNIESSITINGSLLKAGVSVDSRFGGVLQMRDNKPFRFIDLIYYSGSTLDPSQVFIRAKMTDVQGVVGKGEGKILANFREILAQCQPLVERVTNRLKEGGVGD